MTLEEIVKAARAGQIDDLPPVLDIPVAGAIGDLSRGRSYAAAADGSMPVVRIGGRKLVPTRKWLAKLNGEAA